MLNINIKAAAARAVFMVISRKLRNSVDQRPYTAAARRCWTRTRLLTHKQTNEFAAHEQLRAAAARNGYLALKVTVKVKVKLSLSEAVEAHRVVKRRGSHIF
jgi:hypothetical protein